MSGLPKRKLFVYLTQTEAAADPVLAQGLGAFDPAAEAFTPAFDDAESRRAFRLSLLERKILCSYAPVPPRARSLFRSFLDGTQPARCFNGKALALGPAWYAGRDLHQKFWLLVSIEAVAGFLNHILLPRLGHSPMPNLAAYGLPAGLAFLYAGYYGDHDWYLYRIKGERLWPAFPWKRWKIPYFLFLAAGVVAGFGNSESTVTATHDIMDDSGKKVAIRFVAAFKGHVGDSWVGGDSAGRRAEGWKQAMAQARLTRVDTFTLGKLKTRSPVPLYCLDVAEGTQEVDASLYGYPKLFEDSVDGEGPVCFWPQQIAKGEPPKILAIMRGGLNISLGELSALKAFGDFVDEPLDLGAVRGRHARYSIQYIKDDAGTHQLFKDAYYADLGDGRNAGFTVVLTGEMRRPVDSVMRNLVGNLRRAE